MKTQQNYINHIALVIDASASMQRLTQQVIKVADSQIQHLAQRSKELDQETRITLYTFDYSTNIKCVFYDKDVLRMPSLAGLYKPDGMTALVDATLKAMDDLAKTPELYGDHAFLVYVLTDGAENASKSGSHIDLSRRLGSLKDNWTVAVFVPDQSGKFEAKKFGFPADNIAIWDTSNKGILEVGNQIRQTTDAFMHGRTVGTRGYKNLFALSTDNVTKASVASLTKLHAGQYRLLKVDDTAVIAPFVESHTKRAYKMGEAYYQLSKPEKIQPTKNVVIYENKTHYVYAGKDARSLLGLPDHEIKVAPASHPDYTIFVQSGSVNRKLIAGTKLLLLS
jgi:hypothetical protein